jgi:hypothetical protein
MPPTVGIDKEDTFPTPVADPTRIIYCGTLTLQLYRIF